MSRVRPLLRLVASHYVQSWRSGAVALICCCGALGGAAFAQVPAGSKPTTTAPGETPPTTTGPDQPPRLTPAQRSQLADAYGARALAAYDADKFPEANKLAEDAMRLREDQPEAALVIGLLYKRTGRPRDALPLFEKYIKHPSERGKNDWRGYEAAGDIFMMSNQPSLAANYYRLALPKAPPQPVGTRNVKSEIQLKLAEALAGFGKGKEALELVSVARVGLARNAELQVRMARILFAAKENEDAMSALDGATQVVIAEIEPVVRSEKVDASELHTKLMLLDEVHRMRMKHLEERFAQAKPEERAEIRLLVAKAYADSGENDRNLKLARAMATLQLGMQENPKRADLLVELAGYQQAFGLRAAAISTLRDALVVDPNNAKARELLARLGAPATTQNAASLK